MSSHQIDNNLIINEATKDCEEVPVETKVDSVDVRGIYHQQTNNFSEGGPSLTRRKMPGTELSTVNSRRSRLLSLPAELRNMIYSMVLDDIPKKEESNYRRPLGDFSLIQPALARVNRQLRSDILPMFYYHKGSFGMRILPKDHADVNEVWYSWVDRFQILKIRPDGGDPFLPHIQSLEVELWHPANKYPSDQTDADGNAPPEPYDGIYLQFGGSPRPDCNVRLASGIDGMDWNDRFSVRVALLTGIVESRRGIGLDLLELLLENYPLERLVDLVMMIANGCKKAAQVIYIGTYFAIEDDVQTMDGSLPSLCVVQ